MNTPKIKTEIIAVLGRKNNNPRNSEGDFIRLSDGRILYAYSHYTGSSEDDDAPCSIAAMISSNNGQSFKHLPGFLISAEEHEIQNIMSVSFIRLDDETLCIFYLCKYGAQSEYVMRRCIDEKKLIFASPEIVIERNPEYYYVVNNARVLKDSTGNLYVPAARHRIIKKADNDENIYFAESFIIKCDANAKNRRSFSPVFSMQNPGYSETGFQEPGIIELPDKRFYAYFRTDRAFQYESFYSADSGWSEPNASRFTSPESPMLIKRNPYSGIYFAFWNPIPNYNGRLYNEKRWIHAGRNPLVMAVSENGIDFSDYAVIENDPVHGFCYPSVYFIDRNSFLLAYCCGGEEDGNCLAKSMIRKITVS